MSTEREQCPIADTIICPVCGYYCLGKGGVGCIDKLGMVEAAQQATARHIRMCREPAGAQGETRALVAVQRDPDLSALWGLVDEWRTAGAWKGAMEGIVMQVQGDCLLHCADALAALLPPRAEGQRGEAGK